MHSAKRQSQEQIQNSKQQKRRYKQKRQVEKNQLDSLSNSSSSNDQINQKEQQLSEVQSRPGVQFGQNPIQMKCPFCLQNIRTQIILKPEFISIIFGFSLFLIFPHVLTLIGTIIVLQMTSTRKHRCPVCERELGNDGKFLVFFKDQVYSFALGANGIIISKKILASIAIGIFIFSIISIKLFYSSPTIEWTQLTWSQYYWQCPSEEVSKKCSQSNSGLTVKNWYGYVMRVEDNRRSFRKHFEHAVNIFVKMNDEKSFLLINRQKPDILLTINNYQAHIWQQILDNLSHGDQIVFNATFEFLRNNRSIPMGRHLNIVDLNKTGHVNKDIHVYISADEDNLFFKSLSGDKLRKNQNEEVRKIDSNKLSELVEELEKKVSQQLKKDNQQNLIKNEHYQKKN